MEAKQARHLEWGRLQLTGQPIVAGAAIGPAQLMWAACRTSKCLVHVFQDSHLMSIWRFCSDPVFLQFGVVSRDHQAAETSAERADNSRNDTTEASLLVITLDGRIWHLNLSSNGVLNDRPTKKRKEAVPEELSKAMSKAFVTKADDRPSFAPNSWQESTWGVPKDPGLCSSEVEDTVVSCPADGRWVDLIPRDSGDASADENCVAGESGDNPQDYLGLSRLKLRCTKVLVHTRARYRKKPRIRLVSPSVLVGIAHAASLATFGPNGVIALVAQSGALNIMQSNFFQLSKATSVTSVPDVGPPTASKDPTCILSAAVLFHCDAVQAGGNAAMLQNRLFKAIFGEVGNSTLEFGLLQGDRDGSVYAISLKKMEAVVNSCTRVLCNLSQPIVAILVVPSFNRTFQKLDQIRSGGPSKESEVQGDSLLIVGQLGQIILITGVKEESNELEDGLFLPVRRVFSWRAKGQSPAAAQLNEKSLTLHEWDLGSPITSACMVGAYRLCYCSRTELLYVDLFQVMDHGSIRLKSARKENSSRHWTENNIPCLSKSEPSKVHSSSRPSGLPSGRWTLKEELVSYIVPIADTVVAIAGRGSWGASGGSRPLLALTARGRLLGVEVSDHVSSLALRNEANLQRTWRSLQSRMEEHIKELLGMVAEVTEYVNVIKSHQMSITLALKELATAFQLVYDICSDETRYIARCPDSSLIEEAPSSNLCSLLTVIVQPSVCIPKGFFSFGQEKETPSSHGSNRCVVKIGVRLYNHSHVTLSPYWSLLLELHTLSASPAEVVSFSTVINRGLGLPVGAHFSHDFDLEIPSTGVCPSLVSVFLCHLHDPHQSIVDFQPSGSAFSNNIAQKSKNILEKISVNVRDTPGNKSTSSDEEKSRKGTLNKVTTGHSPGAVCVLLSRYRIDVLSLLRSPSPQLAANPWIYPKMGIKSGHLEASFNDDHLLGLFSGCITLSSTDSATLGGSNGMEVTLQELHLGDLLHIGTVPKAAERRYVSVADGGTLSVSVTRGSGGGSSSISILFQASSLLLGSLVREALLWRLHENACHFVLQETLVGNLLRSEKIEARPGEQDSAHNHVSKFVQNMQSMTTLWRNLSTSRDLAIFASLLDDTRRVIEGVVKAYRTHREDISITSLMER